MRVLESALLIRNNGADVIPPRPEKKTPVRAGVGGQTRHKTGGCRVNVPGLYPRYFVPQNGRRYR